MALTSPVEPTGVLLVVEAAGPPDPVDALAAALDQIDGVRETAVATDEVNRRELWAVREHHTESIGRLGVPLKFDVTVPASALASFVGAMPGVVGTAAPGSRTWLFGHVGDGNLHVNVTGVDTDDAASVARVEEAVLGHVVAVDGSISAEHGIGRAKRDWLARNRDQGDIAAMARIKTALDPDGILNPGVLVGGHAS